MEENKRSGVQSGSLSERQARQRASAGLEIEAGFEVWLAFLRQHLGSSYAWDRPFTSDLEQVNAIDAETSLLLKIAPEWSAEEFYSACVTADPDFTKGSEHYVTRYFEGSSPRVVKATIPGKYGRHEYSPSVYQLLAFVSAVRTRLGYPGARSPRSTYFKQRKPSAKHCHKHAIH